MLGQNAVWEKILEFGKSNKGKLIPLLNPKKGSPFTVVEVSEDYIRIDKLPIKMTKQMFLSLYDYLKSKRGWIEIGARRMGARSDTIEGFIKQKFFNGNMDALSTATWFAAILVHSNIGVEFNNKAIGQKLRLQAP
jgi:hypothetical protein